ncbi:MAG: cation:proton antiporter [Phycisphaerae bacterium]|nr:cation:proton antiporter [Phycisphaerae bacterium]
MSTTAPQSIALALGFGALVTVVCRRVGVPALIPLIGLGLLLGRSGAGLVDSASLGDALRALITVAIGLLIFEGSLHLNREELRNASRAVWGLLSVGVVATWSATAVLAVFTLGFTWPVAILLGAILIVTGPTVVQPILRVLRVSPRLDTALRAEAILVDAIGVLATVTTLEVLRVYLRSGVGTDLAEKGLSRLFLASLGGMLTGLCGGIVGYWLLRLSARQQPSNAQALNLIAVGVSMTCVGVGEAIASDAGLVAVTICGLIMAQARVLGATELRAFKELLATLLVGTLFILLASRFDVELLKTITWSEFAFVAGLLLFVRPLCVGVAAWGSQLTWRERLFASVFAPRGIVALAVTAIASEELRLFVTPELAASNPALAAVVRDADRLELVMFVSILGTVIAASLFSPLFSYVLRVRAGRGNAVVIIGAHQLGIQMAQALKALDVNARLVDANPDRAADARASGVDVMEGDATDTRWLDDVGSPPDAGWLISWTGNDSVDFVAARWAEERFGLGHAAIWPQRQPRPEWENFVVGYPITRNDALEAASDGDVRIGISSDAECMAPLLGWMLHGVLTLAIPGVRVPEPGSAVRYFGLMPASAPSPAATTEAPTRV